MSISKTVKCKIKLDQMEAAALAKGLNVRKNTRARLYGRSKTSENFPLVVDCGDSYDIGFGEEKYTADYHSGSVDRTLNTLMPEYYMQAGLEDEGYQMLSTKCEGEEIVMIAER